MSLRLWSPGKPKPAPFHPPTALAVRRAPPGCSRKHSARHWPEPSGGRMATEQRWTDKALGMHRLIGRRDFLNGVAVGAGILGAPPAMGQPGEAWPQDQPGYDPPLLTGLRGSHPGSFETAHVLRN